MTRRSTQTPLHVAILCFGFGLIGPVCLAADTAEKRPKTISGLFRKMGEPAAKEGQLKLKIEAEISGKDLGKMPKSMNIELLYDKSGSRVRAESLSVYPDGKETRSITYSDKRRAATWIEPADAKPKADGSELSGVQPLEPAEALPNPWTLPVKLAFPGLFADALHGYEALAREYSRSVRLNRVPDEAGLIWFDMRPSATSGVAMRREFNEGLKVKAGFADDGGWLKELEVQFPKGKAVMKLRVVEQATELSKEDVAKFGIPDRVLKQVLAKPRSVPVNDEKSLLDAGKAKTRADAKAKAEKEAKEKAEKEAKRKAKATGADKKE